MKPAIKKLKTCTYSKDLAPTAAVFGQREQHTNKLVCDQPEMKLNWSENVCGPCTAYENRNAELVVPVPQPPQPVRESPAKAASPAPVRPVPPVVTPPPVSSAPAIPAQAKPASKPAVAKPGPFGRLKSMSGCNSPNAVRKFESRIRRCEWLGMMSFARM